MAYMIAVHVPHQLLSEAVQKAEFGRGRDWAYDTSFSIRTLPNDAYGEDACIILKEGCFSYADKRYCIEAKVEVLTVDEYFHKYVMPSAIKICGNEVRILRRGFCVGDVYMTWDQYDKIGERR